MILYIVLSLGTCLSSIVKKIIMPTIENMNELCDQFEQLQPFTPRSTTVINEREANTSQRGMSAQGCSSNTTKGTFHVGEALKTQNLNSIELPRTPYFDDYPTMKSKYNPKQPLLSPEYAKCLTKEVHDVLDTMAGEKAGLLKLAAFFVRKFANKSFPLGDDDDAPCGDDEKFICWVKDIF